MKGVSGAIGTVGVIAVACSGASSTRTAERIPPAAEDSVAPTAGQLAPSRFDPERAWKALQAPVAFGPRPSGSAALQKTRDYILSELKKAGIDSRQQIFVAKTPLGEVSMANVIATIPGRRSERIGFASHFDTKLFRDIRFVGASDGASSTAARP